MGIAKGTPKALPTAGVLAICCTYSVDLAIKTVREQCCYERHHPVPKSGCFHTEGSRRLAVWEGVRNLEGREKMPWRHESDFAELGPQKTNRQRSFLEWIDVTGVARQMEVNIQRP